MATINWKDQDQVRAYKAQKAREYYARDKDPKLEGKKRAASFKEKYPNWELILEDPEFDASRKMAIKLRHCLMGNYTSWDFNALGDRLGGVSRQRAYQYYAEGMARFQKEYDALNSHE